MTPLLPVSAELSERLLGLLDEEVILLERRCRQMEELARVVLARDDDRMEPLLAEMDGAQREQEAADGRLQAVRSDLARAAGRGAEGLRLREAAQWLPAGSREAVEDRRRRLAALAEELRRRHLTTAVALSECVRVNRLLLQAFLPAGQELTTYSQEGPARWRGGAGIVDAER